METTEDDKNYFNVEVFGDYFVAGTEGNVIRSFGYVTLRMRVWDNCQNLARFHIIPNLLRDADPEFQNMRKCVVTKVTTSDGQPVYNIPLAFMSREDIALEVKSNNIPLRVDMCNDIIELRKKLRFARSNPQEFAKQEAKRTKSFSKIDDAMVLNKDVFSKIRNKGKDLLSGKIINMEPPAGMQVTQLPTAAQMIAEETEKAKKQKQNQRTIDKYPEVQVENPNENKEKDEVDEFSL